MTIFRDAKTLVDDGLISENSHIEVSIGAFNQRSAFVFDVLQQMPADDYAIFKVKKPWILAPTRGVMGWNARIPEGKTQVIYLPEWLENLGKTTDCKLAVAHEIAHCILGHTDSSSSPEIEAAAWQKVIEQGFATQEAVDAFRRSHRV